MPSTNDVTGDRLVSKVFSPQGEANFDKIFGKKEDKKEKDEETNSTDNTTNSK